VLVLEQHDDVVRHGVPPSGVSAGEYPACGRVTGPPRRPRNRHGTTAPRRPYQLILNTVTSIATFLIVFIVGSAQNGDNRDTQV
jgi:hypothetical protein